MQVLIRPETGQTRLWKEPALLFAVVHVLTLIVNMQLVRHFVVKVMQMTALLCELLKRKIFRAKDH